ncbi:hypothetical protein [Sphingomonas sp.]
MEQLAEAGSLLDPIKPRESPAEVIEIALAQQSYGYDTFPIGHIDS